MELLLILDFNESPGQTPNYLSQRTCAEHKKGRHDKLAEGWMTKKSRAKKIMTDKHFRKKS